MKYSLIIPAYNEAPVILPTVRSLIDVFEQQKDFHWEIIVVDNASTDNTKEQIRDFNHPQVSVIALTEKGKGRAVRAGFAKAAGEIVGFTDADLSVEPKEILAAFLAVSCDEADIVVGSRAHKKSISPGREWWRTGSSEIFHLLAKEIVGVRVRDTQCPLKVMNTLGVRVMLGTQEETWFFDLEFLALCESLRLRVKEVPVTWNEHRYPDRKSKLSTVRDGVRSVGAMFRIKRRLPAQLTVLANISRVE